MHPRSQVQKWAHGHGFSHVRVAALGPDVPRLGAYDAWLSAGHHGEMSYLPRGRDVRADPACRLSDARTVLVLGVDHHHAAPPDPGGLTGKVARYAWGRDYHNLVGKRLKRLAKHLRQEGIGCWGGVDTAPILERAWAERAGLGFSGKNCVQIVPATTSWLFLGVLFLDLDLEPDVPLGDHCGACTRCLVACPTDAFQGPHNLDARRCISYWTIECRGAIPVEMRAGLGRWVFGCDVCQEVCPHNAAAIDPEEDDLLPRNAWLPLDWLLLADAEEIDARFLGTPLRRPGVPGLRRNAALVLGNLGKPEAIEVLRSGAGKHGEPVEEAITWSLDRLGA